MKQKQFCIKILSLLLLFILQLTASYSICSAADAPLLSKDEIKEFIRDTPLFVNELKKINEDRRMIDLFLHPEKVSQDEVVFRILEDLSWNPERYAYIFSRVIIAGFIKDMGQFGEGKLDFLKVQLVKWEASNEPEPERTAMIEGLKQGIKDLEMIVQRTKSIPKKELLLMWEYRDELNAVLMGKLPIGKKGVRVLK